MPFWQTEIPAFLACLSAASSKPNCDGLMMRLAQSFRTRNRFHRTSYLCDNHTLKGVAGNLSLTPVYEKASAICEATRNKKDGVDVSKEMDDLIETTSAVIKKIEEIIL